MAITSQTGRVGAPGQKAVAHQTPARRAGRAHALDGGGGMGSVLCPRRVTLPWASQLLCPETDPRTPPESCEQGQGLRPQGASVRGLCPHVE